MTNAFVQQLDEWGKNKVPFLFMVDFEGVNPRFWPLDQIPDGIRFQFRNPVQPSANSIQIKPIPISFEEYAVKFHTVFQHLQRGDSYLTNLTIRTPLTTTATLNEIFDAAQATYKLVVENEFVVFSPESFIQIEKDIIRTYPMKGTMDASVPNADSLILENPKEFAEHTTIVDLLRNDVSQVATEVAVERFRYLETLRTGGKELIQVSSAIRGTLSQEMVGRFGTILNALLPAGSVSGAPKEKTCAIIREAEGEPRGYYSGVAGIYDGNKLDSFVMIRFIEQRGDSYFYRSGGGITAQSKAAEEYQEALDKIYVPIN